MVVMEIFLTIGTWILGVLATIVTIWKAIEPISRSWGWLRSWKILKREDFNRLKASEAEHQNCEARYRKLKASYDSLQETCAPYLEQGRKELVSAFVKRRQVKVDGEINHFNPEPIQTFEIESEPDPRVPFRNRK
jgi:hypothetical protein